MGFCVVKGDLLKQKYDAIVIPSQPSLRLEGVIGEHVKKICGDRLELELKQLKNINISDCVITNAYNLDCKKLIHVANPKWDGGKNREEYNLHQSYLSCLELAQDFELESIAFPLLSSGAYDFPKRKAIEIAIETITDFVEDNDMDVALVIYHESTFNTYRDIFKEYEIKGGHLSKEEKEHIELVKSERQRFGWYKKDTDKILENGPEVKAFKDKLVYYMTLKGLNSTDVYSGVISKAAFNNIMNNGAVPKKYTVVSLGIGMGLYTDEIDDLLVPLGERLLDVIDKDAIIINGINREKSIEQINSDLVSEGYAPLKTN